MINIIALDPGFGNTKVAMDHFDHYGYQVNSIQSSVSRPSSIGQAAIGMATSLGARLVQFADFEFCVGTSAWTWGRSLTNLDYSALASPERKALFYGALASLVPSGEYEARQLVIGLPVPLLQDGELTSQVLDGLRQFKGDHQFCVDGNSYNFTFDRVKVLAQPVGAYGNWLLGPDYQPVTARLNGEAAVLDIGMNTLDLYVIKGGEVSPRYVGGSKMGVRRLLEMVAEPDEELDEVDARLRTRQRILSQVDLQSWMQEVLASVERHWPSLRRFSVILPAGGGAILLGDLLRQELILRGAAIYWPEDAVNANVIGLWKWAMHVFNRQQM